MFRTVAMGRNTWQYQNMKYAGMVKAGVVVLDGSAPLEDGTVVTVEAVRDSSALPLGKRLKKFAGIMKGMPADMAQNHDHYLHGQKK